MNENDGIVNYDELQEELLNNALKEHDRMQDDIKKNFIEETDVYSKFTGEFPKEAYSKDSSRGFDLTSVKAQYIVERLNESLGFMNWTFTGQYQSIDSGILFIGSLTITVNGKRNTHIAPGFSAPKKGKVDGDTYKSAHTDSLSKCASKFGIANDVFKGLINPNGSKKTSSSTTTTKATAKVPTTNTWAARKPLAAAKRTTSGDGLGI